MLGLSTTDCVWQRTATFGHSCLKKTRVGNDRSQSTTDVARRRNRNEKLYKAGARSSVTLAAQNADRRAAVSEIELALSTLSSRNRTRKAAFRIAVLLRADRSPGRISSAAM